MSPFDLVIRGGILVDGSGEAARTADIGVVGDRIAASGDLRSVDPASGDLRSVDPASVPLLLDIPGHIVAPGFIDPHGHSDASVLVDGALVSHLRQGFTTQLSGNCGDSLAPGRRPGRLLRRDA